MANTEGLPDEFVESLMYSNDQGNQSSGPRPISSAARRRLDMPIDGRPAARVVRPSPQIRTTRSKVVKKKKGNPIRRPETVFEEDGDASEPHTAPVIEPERTSEAETKQPTGPLQATPSHDSITPLVGAVVERPDIKNKESATNASSGRRVSAFRAQRQERSGASSVAHARGFPSANVPLGTFVKNKNRRNVSEPPKSSLNKPVRDSAIAEKRSARSSKEKLPSTISDGQHSNDGSGSNTMGSLEKVSQTDAQSMIDAMTPSEIQESVQEINSMLSPQMRAFLRKRGENKKKNAEHHKSVHVSQEISQKKAPSDHPRPDASKNDAEEKQRLAHLLASVRTMDDLDTLYRREMNDFGNGAEMNKSPSNELQEGSDAEFYQACSLLRSSSPRQALWSARTICRYLKRVYKEEYSVPLHGSIKLKMKEPWADVLPVSLRCILDQPPHTNGYALHAYALQSLDFLLKLLVDPDHVVDANYESRLSDFNIHRNFFMDDSDPSTSVQSVYSSEVVRPIISGDVSSSTEKDAVAYSTSSSSASAQSDAQAFMDDPMWTLLSRMRIVPRIAQLLKIEPQVDKFLSLALLPREGLVALCGILAMIAKRSPGAATMITHHPTVLPSICELTIHADNVEDDTNLSASELRKSSVYSVLVLLYTLARQSRIAASHIDLEGILPRILADLPSNQLDFDIQQMALSLWRVCLRYGLGLGGFSAMMTLAAPHLALDSSHKYSLSTEFISCFTAVADCLRSVRDKTTKQMINVVSTEQVHALSMAQSRLSSVQRQVSVQLFSEDEPELCISGNVSLCRWVASRLHFLAVMWEIAGMDIADGESKSEEPTVEDAETCLGKLFAWLDSDGLLGTASEILFESRRPHAASRLQSVQSRQMEAASSSLIIGIISLLMAVSNGHRCTENLQLRNSAKSIAMQCTGTLVDGIRTLVKNTRSSDSQQSLLQPSSIMQERWISQGFFAIVKFLSHAVSVDLICDSSDISCVRMLLFSLIGTLKRGDESLAAILFSQDAFFQSQSDPLGESPDSTSRLSSLFLAELCGSSKARSQLDHSFKLNRGVGITKNGFGSFGLESMLSAAEQSGPKDKFDNDSVLPMGAAWLWKTLAGSIQISNEGDVIRGKTEAAGVISATLGVISDLEGESDALFGGVLGIGETVSLGSRMYYLSNICLHNEDILREPAVAESAESIIIRYLSQINKHEKGLNISDFISECALHLQNAKEASKANDDKLTVKDKELLSVFVPEKRDNLGYSTVDLQAIESLVEDLAKAYVDYGAQYDFFTRVIRFFFCRGFPSSVKASMARHLQGAMHLLTLPGEDDKEMSILLKQTVTGGLPKADGSERDMADILDVAAASLIQGASPRPLNGFALWYFLSLLIRDLAISLSAQESGTEAAARHRIELDSSLAAFIEQAAKNFIDSSGTDDDLVSSVAWAVDKISHADVKLK